MRALRFMGFTVKVPGAACDAGWRYPASASCRADRESSRARTSRGLSCLVSLGTAVVCGCGEAPTAPAADALASTFIAGYTVVAPGELSQLKSYRMVAEEEVVEASTAARWETSSPDVVFVTGGGLVSGVAEGEAVVRASVRGVVGTARVFVVRRGMAPVDEYSGEWTGTLRVVACERLLGTGRNPCQVGRSNPVQLTLADNAGALEGIFRLASSPPGRIRGFRAHDGAAVFSGSLPDPPFMPEWHIRRLRLQLEGGALKGSDLTDRTFPNVLGPQVLEQRHELEFTRVQ